MRKYIWLFIITIPILIVVWNRVDSAEEPKNTYNDIVEKSEINQVGILQGTDGIMPEEVGNSKMR